LSVKINNTIIILFTKPRLTWRVNPRPEMVRI